MKMKILTDIMNFYIREFQLDDISC